MNQRPHHYGDPSSPLVDDDAGLMAHRRPRQGGAAINWGRSYPLGALAGGQQELVRVTLAVPADITIKLGNPNQQTFQRVLNTITVGNGGSSGDEFTQLNTVLGSVLHVSATSVIVRAQQVGDVVGDQAVRYQAQAAIGRPSPQQYTDQQNLSNQVGVDHYALRPWAHSFRIDAYESFPARSGNAPPNAFVRQQYWENGAVVVANIVNWRLLNDVNGQVLPIDPLANVLEISGGGGGGDPTFLYSYQITQYWTL